MYYIHSINTVGIYIHVNHLSMTLIIIINYFSHEDYPIDHQERLQTQWHLIGTGGQETTH